MKNLYFNPIVFLLCVFAFLVSCTKEKDAGSIIPEPTTSFDKTQVADKTFTIGDRLQYTIGLMPNRQVKELAVTIRTLKGDARTSTSYQKIQLNDSDQPFDYNLDFVLSEQYRGVEKVTFEFNLYFSVPEESGRISTSPLVFSFFVNQ